MLSRRLSMRRHGIGYRLPSGPSDWYLAARGMGVKVTKDSEGFGRFEVSHPSGENGYSGGYAASDGQVGIPVGRSGLPATADLYKFDKTLFPGMPSQSLALAVSPALVSSVLLRDRILVLVSGPSSAVFRQWPWTTTRGTDIPVDFKLTNGDQTVRIYTNGGRHAFLFRTANYHTIETSGQTGTVNLTPGSPAKITFGKTTSATTDFFWGRIASTGGGMSNLGLPADARLTPFVPDGASGGSVWSRKIEVQPAQATSHRDQVFVRLSIRYQEVRRGADGEPVGGITRALMSVVQGTMNALAIIGPDGEMTITNITSRRVNYAPWGYYALVEKASTYELHINEYSDGVSEVDFPPVAISPHPQYFNGLTQITGGMIKFGDHILSVDTTEIERRLSRIEIGNDSMAGVSFSGAPPSGTIRSITALENHGLLHCLITVPASGGGSVTWTVHQSKDAGQTWAALPSATGSPYLYFPPSELIPF